MSEYQYYEFQVIDRPLTAAEMRELRNASTRASITPTRFVNEYEWGDFKGNPKIWIEKDGGNRDREKDPNVCAVSRARDLDTGRNFKLSAGNGVCHRIFAPACPVKVVGNKTASVILKYEVYAENTVSREMRINRILGNRQKRFVGALRALDPGLFANAGNPLVEQAGL